MVLAVVFFDWFLPVSDELRDTLVALFLSSVCRCFSLIIHSVRVGAALKEDANDPGSPPLSSKV